LEEGRTCKQRKEGDGRDHSKKPLPNVSPEDEDGKGGGEKKKRRGEKGPGGKEKLKKVGRWDKLMMRGQRESRVVERWNP